METNIELVPIRQVVLGENALTWTDVIDTIHINLTKHELQAYHSACMKVIVKEKLSRFDAMLFNKIDEITKRVHGMCLKDSKVTKARLIACKRFGIKFVDRDNLIDHMKMFLD